MADNYKELERKTLAIIDDEWKKLVDKYQLRPGCVTQEYIAALIREIPKIFSPKKSQRPKHGLLAPMYFSEPAFKNGHDYYTICGVPFCHEADATGLTSAGNEVAFAVVPSDYQSPGDMTCRNCIRIYEERFKKPLPKTAL